MDKETFLEKLEKIAFMVGDKDNSRILRIYREKKRYYLRLEEIQEISKHEFEEIASLFYDAKVLQWEKEYEDRSLPRGYDWGLEIYLDGQLITSDGDNNAPDTFQELLRNIASVIAYHTSERHGHRYDA